MFSGTLGFCNRSCKEIESKSGAGQEAVHHYCLARSPGSVDTSMGSMAEEVI